mgnify:CR=1
MNIEYPQKLNESELQAQLWAKLKSRKIDARLQVKAIRSRIDIVIFKKGQATGIIECKCWSKSYLKKQRYRYYKKSKQYQKYTQLFGLPIFVCGCSASIEPAIHFAGECCK